MITFFSSISVSKVSILAELQSPDTVHTLQQQNSKHWEQVAELQSPDTVHTLQQQTLGTSSTIGAMQVIEKVWEGFAV